MRIQALRVDRPPPNEAVRVTAPPYDTLSTAEARALAQDNPLSFLHVSRSEWICPTAPIPIATQFMRARRNISTNCASEEHLIRDSVPAIYIYEQHWKDHVQRGFVVLVPRG